MRLPLAPLVCLIAPSLFADDGIWLFHQFPAAAVKETHQFDVTPAFLEKLRLATVKIGAGSGSFVSPTGLLLTNQHLIANCLTTSKKDYLKDGYQAASQAEELPCPGLTADVLLGTEDVTAKVKASAQRAEAIANLEKACGACSVVSMYSGGRYELHRYKRYADVRLVFAPEQALAFFGREKDAITYLRYGLDAAFLRAYEDGKPAATPNYLKWSAAAIKEGDLVFTSGNPGPTARATTASQLTHMRDREIPAILWRLGPRIKQLSAMAAASGEGQAAAQELLKVFLEKYKVSAGKLIGLNDARLMVRKAYFDKRIRQVVENDPKLGADAGKLWDDIAKGYKSWSTYERGYQLIAAEPALGSTLFRVARALLEGKDPGEGKINEALETVMLQQYFEELKARGDREVKVKDVLHGKSPEQAADSMVKLTKLKDPAERKRLAATQGLARKSDDPVIRLALLLEAPAKKLAKTREDMIGKLEATSVEKISQFRMTLFGAEFYPDGTSTARVSFGVLKSYTDRAGVPAPYAATFGGLYYRRDNQGPYQVPERWVQAKESLDPVAPLDFVSTCDIGGGNPGAPTVNKAGELVGLLFDGNLESLPVVYLYSDEQARAVHVAAQGIVEALKKVFKASSILRELGLSSEISSPST